MRSAIVAVLILFLAPFSGLVSADSGINMDLNNEERDLIIPTYSIAVQLAFERVSNLEQYSVEELENTKKWLIVTDNTIEKQKKFTSAPYQIEESSVLHDAYIWTYYSSENLVNKLDNLMLNDEIESFSPLITKKQITRSLPNDEDFDEQWHLRNTGQTSGLSGEDGIRAKLLRP